MKPATCLLLLSFSTAVCACEGDDKKKELLAKTQTTDAGAAMPSGVAIVPPTAASSAAPPPKPPKECGSGPEIAIDDPDLEAELRLKAQKPKDKNPGALTAADLAKVTSVNLAAKKSIDEIDPCVFPKLVNVKGIYLPPGKYRDLGPIANLTKLESLRLSISEVEDV